MVKHRIFPLPVRMLLAPLVLLGALPVIAEPTKAPPIPPASATPEQTPKAIIYVLGAVAAPDKYPFSEGMTLADAIARARGPWKEADVRRVVILRRERAERAENGKPEMTVRTSVYDLTNPADAAAPLRAGDVIDVPYPRSPRSRPRLKPVPAVDQNRIHG